MQRILTNRISLLLIRLFSSPTAISLLFVAALLATLTAGLWPFRAPLNDAVWIERDRAIQFRQEGTAISDGVLRTDRAVLGPCTLELWLRPLSAWTSGTIADFYNSERNREFAITQEGPDMLLRLIAHDKRGSEREQVLRLPHVFRRPEFLLTATSNGKKTLVYIDGQLIQSAPYFPLSGADLAAQLILANAPRRSYAWAGEVKGLGVYFSELNANEVLQHARQWSATGSPTISPGQTAAALYMVDKPWHDRIPNAVPGEPDLVVPRKFQTVDQLRFESVQSEEHFDGGYRNDAILNILGFIPLGGVAAWFWSVFLRRRSAVAAAIVTGAATSFVIEYLQSYLPTRYSGTTDLITNSMGTCIGVALYFLATRLLTNKKKRVERFAQPV